MEMIAIILSFPVALTLLIIYSILLHLLLARFEELRAYVLSMSAAILIGFTFEIISLLRFGIIETKHKIGPAFYPLHVFFFFATAPSLVGVFIVYFTRIWQWFIGIFICSIVAVLLVLLQYTVSEALFGIT